MKKTIAILIAACTISAIAQTRVDGYVKKDGTYVAPHMRSDSNSTKLDNYGTKGNVNPYTGQQGTVDPYKPEPIRQQQCGYTQAGQYVCR